jgi:mRNA interferase RelE/StbE
MVYQVRIKASALRFLKKLETRPRARLLVAISGLSDEPRPPGCRKITGVAGLWRIRIGKYRIIYQVWDKELVVLVVRVGHRSDVYR